MKDHYQPTDYNFYQQRFMKKVFPILLTLAGSFVMLSGLPAKPPTDKNISASGPYKDEQKRQNALMR